MKTIVHYDTKAILNDLSKDIAQAMSDEEDLFKPDIPGMIKHYNVDRFRIESPELSAQLLLRAARRIHRDWMHCLDDLQFPGMGYMSADEWREESKRWLPVLGGTENYRHLVQSKMTEIENRAIRAERILKVILDAVELSSHDCEFDTRSDKGTCHICEALSEAHKLIQNERYLQRT